MSNLDDLQQATDDAGGESPPRDEAAVRARRRIARRSPTMSAHHRPGQRRPAPASKSEPTTQQMIVGGAVLVGVLILGMAWLFGGSSSSPAEEAAQHRETKEFTERIGAWVAAQDAVRSRLRSPGTADFGWQTASNQCKKSAPGQYIATGWVDSQNGFGAVLRTEFTVKVEQGGSGSWRAVDGPHLTSR